MSAVTLEQFLYNDEFFFDAADRKRASEEYPDIWFALYSEHVSKAFRELDEETKALKAGFQRWGLSVVGLAIVALSLAAIEPSLLHPAAVSGNLPMYVVEGAAVLAAVAGLLSMIFGYFGMGFWSRKGRWLRMRLLCERIRQWRWQYFCGHMEEIIEAADQPAL